METKLPENVQIQIAETKTLSDNYMDYSIDTPKSYIASADDLKKIKAKAKELNETRMSLTRPIEESKKKIIAFFKEPLDFLSRAEDAVKKAMIIWQQEQERLRREEEARLAEIQRKEAERLQREAAKEAARAESLKTDKAKAAAAAKAEELKAQAEATTAIAPTVESTVEEVSGISTRKAWKFEIVDKEKLPREYMIPDEKYIGQMVRATKGRKEIPGVRIYSEDIIASRS